jgi:hypothetical protein
MCECGVDEYRHLRERYLQDAKSFCSMMYSAG